MTPEQAEEFFDQAASLEQRGEREAAIRIYDRLANDLAGQENAEYAANRARHLREYETMADEAKNPAETRSPARTPVTALYLIAAWSTLNIGSIVLLSIVNDPNLLVLVQTLVAVLLTPHIWLLALIFVTARYLCRTHRWAWMSAMVLFVIGLLVFPLALLTAFRDHVPEFLCIPFPIAHSLQINLAAMGSQSHVKRHWLKTSSRRMNVF